MNKLLTAIALTIALPAVAHAQATPAPASKMAPAGHDMSCTGIDHSKMDKSKMDHSKMDMSKMGHSKMCQQPNAKPADATTNQNHQH